jgi:superfamily II DNA or RNA helicase
MQKLKNNGSVFLSCYTGMGKTAMAIYLCITLKLKTLIVCHLDNVRKQWADEIENFSGGTVRVQFLEGTNVKIDSFADVYIVGVQKLANMDPSLFTSIGTVIVDEAHIATVTAFTKSLWSVHPRYFIGLSATYKRRTDGLHKILYLYFGNEEDFIIRKETKNFTVYKVQTKYKPEIDYIVKFGKTTLDWNLVVNSIEGNEERWKDIADVISKHPTEKIMALCNRNILSKGVHSVLIEREEDVDIYIGKSKKCNKNARVLVAGFKKGGVGTDIPNLTMAVICSDTQDVDQFSGRVRVNNNIIYHFVDNHPTLEKHWDECAKWYLEKGAVIKIIGVDHYKRPVPKNIIEPNEDIIDVEPDEKNMVPTKRFLKSI